MTRRRFLAAALAQRPKLNFVFILADDLGWSDLGVQGSDLHETPRLDRLASQGVRFTNAYSAAPVCTPTRASILTGKDPAKLGMTIWHEAAAEPPKDRAMIPPVARGDLPLSEVTIAEAMHEAGYFTAHIGKWHLGTAAYYPEAQGFDVNIGGTFWGAPQTFFYPYRGSRRFGGEYRYVPGVRGRPGDYLTDRLTDEALDAISRAGSRPFFLNLWHHAPHTPIEAEAARIAHYRSRIRAGMRHRNAAYAAMVESLDTNVGRVLDHLDKRGLAGNTVVVFTSDNGGYINEFDGTPVTNNAPLRSGKGSLYEGGIRVPLFIRWPGVTLPGGVCAEPVSSIDFYRTLLEMSGLEGNAAHNAGIDGVSLAPLLRNPGARLERDALFFHYPHYYPTTAPVSAVRMGRWKLLHYHEDGRVELFDLESDPAESRNIAGEQRARADELLRRLNRWRGEAGAQMPRRNVVR